MICDVCKKENDSDSVFCTHCGANLNDLKDKDVISKYFLNFDVSKIRMVYLSFIILVFVTNIIANMIDLNNNGETVSLSYLLGGIFLGGGYCYSIFIIISLLVSLLLIDKSKVIINKVRKINRINIIISTVIFVIEIILGCICQLFSLDSIYGSIVTIRDFVVFNIHNLFIVCLIISLLMIDIKLKPERLKRKKMFCKKCGVKLAENANYCVECGNKVNSVNQTSINKKIILISVVLIMAVIIGIFLIINVHICDRCSNLFFGRKYSCFGGDNLCESCYNYFIMW